MGLTKREISDEEFARAFRDRDNVGIIRGVTQSFTQLGQDERDSCALNGLWRTLMYHQDGKGNKFTTSLHRFVRWECQRALSRQKKAPPPLPSVNIPDPSYSQEQTEREDTLSHIRDRLLSLPEPLRVAVEDYYFNNMTMQAIGNKHGYSKESARLKIRRGLALLKEACLPGLEE